MTILRFVTGDATGMHSLIKAVLVAVALAFATPVTAQDFEAGWEAAQRDDYVAAEREWRPLAEQGHADAQTKLGQLYAAGRGVPQDDAEAVNWYRKAADQGNALARIALGFNYFVGLGVEKDYIQAYVWGDLAVAQGSEEAIILRKLVARKMTPEEIAEARKLAREWKPKQLQQ